MSDEQLLRSAAEFAAAHGYRDEDYELVSSHPEGGERWVLFQARDGGPGDHVTVVVDAETGEPQRLVLGR